jgi:hypothetical protein
VLTDLNKASTPKVLPPGTACCSIDLPLEDYDDRDLFGEVVDKFNAIGVKVIAFLSAEGPAMLQQGETKAYDYNGNSPFVNSCDLCPGLTGNPAPFCACAPSVWQWKKWVLDNYGSDDDDTLKQSFAEVIVGEFAERYKDKVAGFWIDQGDVADIPRITEVIKAQVPNAVLAFNKGQRQPLKNNNPPYEDATFGYPYFDLANIPASDCRNFKAISGQEETSDGYYYVEGKGSLGHVFTPLNSDWGRGDFVWDLRQAQEWQSRFLNANGAWTWSVKRGRGSARSLIIAEDLTFLRDTYSGLNVARPFVHTCGTTSPPTSM